MLSNSELDGPHNGNIADIMIMNRTRLIAIRSVSSTLLLLCIAAAVFLTSRAGFKLWWEIGAVLIAAPGCLLAGDMLATVIELRHDTSINYQILPRLAHQLRLASIFSFVLLSWMALSLIWQSPLPPKVTWIVLAGVAVVFPAGLLLAAKLSDQVANGRQSNST